MPQTLEYARSIGIDLFALGGLLLALLIKYRRACRTLLESQKETRKWKSFVKGTFLQEKPPGEYRRIGRVQADVPWTKLFPTLQTAWSISDDAYFVIESGEDLPSYFHIDNGGAIIPIMEIGGDTLAPAPIGKTPSGP